MSAATKYQNEEMDARQGDTMGLRDWTGLQLYSMRVLADAARAIDTSEVRPATIPGLMDQLIDMMDQFDDVIRAYHEANVFRMFREEGRLKLYAETNYGQIFAIDGRSNEYYLALENGEVRNVCAANATELCDKLGEEFPDISM